MSPWGLGPGGGLPWRLLSGKWHSGMETSLSLGAGMPGSHAWLCLQLLCDWIRPTLWACFLPVRGIWLEEEQRLVFKTQAQDVTPACYGEGGLPWPGLAGVGEAAEPCGPWTWGAGGRGPHAEGSKDSTVTQSQRGW